MANKITAMTPSGETDSTPAPPLVFIYTGQAAPSYLRWNLRLARKHYSGDIYFLTDHPTSLSDATVVDITPWYHDEAFQRFCEASPLDPYFRQGFWLKAAERFFVLAQFMRTHHISRVFQIESDVLVMDLEGFASQLDSFGTGIFAPPETPTQAVASLMYVNDVEALEKLCDYTISHAHLGNEMKILGHFMAEHPAIAHGLPCNHVLDASWPLMPSTVPSDVGLVDATFLGMWVWGIDPRNSESSMWNHRVPGLTTHPTATLRMIPGLQRKNIKVGLRGGSRHVLRTLHVHSKVFFRLTIPGVLRAYVLLSNLPWRTMIVPKWSMVFHAIPHLFLSNRVIKALTSLPESVRSILSRLVVWSAEHSPRQLSLRQRQQLNRLLPTQRHTGPLDIHHVAIRWDGTESIRLSSVLEALPNEVQVTVISSGNNVSPKRKTSHVEIVRAREVLRGFLSEETLAALANEPEIATELATIAHLHQSLNSPVLVVSSDSGLPFRVVSAGTPSRLPLVFSPEKPVNAWNLAKALWSPSLVDTTWAYSESGQLIDTHVVREMFPELAPSLRRLAELALAPGARSLSCIQLYGAWVRRHHRANSEILQIEV